MRTTPWLAPILGGIGGLFGGLVFITAGAIVGQSRVALVRQPAHRDHRRHLRRRDRPDRVPPGQAGRPPRRRPRPGGCGDRHASDRRRDWPSCETGMRPHDRAEQRPPARHRRGAGPRALRRAAHPALVPAGDRRREARRRRAAPSATASSPCRRCAARSTTATGPRSRRPWRSRRWWSIASTCRPPTGRRSRRTSRRS